EMPANDQEPPQIELRVMGADDDGRMVADGTVRLPTDGLAAVGQVLHRILTGIAALYGQPIGSASPKPANGNQPWTAELDERLASRWAQAPDTTAAKAIATLAEEFGRSRGGIRSRLVKLGCDPDHPGRRDVP
ncbi:MAG: hypothetical protein J2O49_10775, partial [Sciscionella sp.]|nr:hypothetical protein [Sciscionella sp.]